MAPELRIDERAKWLFLCNPPANAPLVSLETRGGRRYYYRARKVGGQVVKVYAGTGVVAEASAAADELIAAEQQRQAEAARAEWARLDALDTPVIDLCRATEAWARAALLMAGYRRHKRGEWRRKRASPK